MEQTRAVTAEEARHFDRISVGNAVLVHTLLDCGCQPYQDVFTYRRWQAQGFQVQRGQKAIRLLLVKAVTQKDAETGEEKTRKVLSRSAVFCRCQIKRREARA